MKRRKKSRRQQEAYEEYDWDMDFDAIEPEQYYEEQTTDDAYYEEYAEEEYYEEEYPEEEYAEEYADEYYEEEYSEEEYSEEEYGEEEYGDEYYEEEYYEEEDPSGEYVEEVPEENALEVWNLEEEDQQIFEYDPEDGEVHPVKEKRDNIFKAAIIKFRDMEPFDRAMMLTGVAVLALAIVVATVFLNNRSSNQAISQLADVGHQIDGINTIGERGLVAVADARLARIEAARVVEDEKNGYDELDYNSDVQIRLNMNSVLKDLKIKFTNEKTGKLVSSVPFSVEITDPDGKTLTWTDDDKDGIIYKKDITPGKYQVTVVPLEEDKYERYKLPTVSETVDVKKDIAYEKIDVSDEVKDETEIDVSKEDTQINDTEVESSLNDTVEWVESTATANNYVEVQKNTIPDPLQTAMAEISGRFGTVSPGDVSVLVLTAESTTARVGVEKDTTVKTTVTGNTGNAALRYTATSANKAIATATVDATGVVTIHGVALGTTQVTVVADFATGSSSPSNKVVIEVTVGGPRTITLDQSSATVYLSEPLVLKATISDDTGTEILKAESSDTGIVTAAVEGRNITLTGVKEGEAVLTVYFTEGTEQIVTKCAVTVKNNPKMDKTTKLKNADGEQIYVSENNKYREAFVADYFTAAHFFIKGEVKYTGWQTIDGKVYFFDKNYKKVTGDQIIQGVKYHFGSDGALQTGNGTMGIDVSKWNGTIDWKAVKNSGISFVIIRCGYRGSSNGMLVRDPKFSANIQGATSAGLKVGVYFFTQALDEVEAVEEASFVLDAISGYKLSYPVFLDVESSGGRADKIDKTTRTAVCKTFCETIKRAGYNSGVYANKTWLGSKMDAGALSAYKIWLAQYAAKPSYTGRYDMWQHTSTGKVSGISGNVDMNISYLGY